MKFKNKHIMQNNKTRTVNLDLHLSYSFAAISRTTDRRIWKVSQGSNRVWLHGLGTRLPSCRADWKRDILLTTNNRENLISKTIQMLSSRSRFWEAHSLIASKVCCAVVCTTPGERISVVGVTLSNHCLPAESRVFRVSAY